MEKKPEKQELYREERQNIHKFLDNNPNYFGTLDDSDLKVVQQIQFNTTYERLTCVGLWPERNLLEATIEVRQPFGFLGDTCEPGSHEYVRFFMDWNNDGDFSDFHEDLGIASVNVHDIPEVKEHHLCYAVRRAFRPFLADCRKPYVIRLRAILSWEIVPPPGNPNWKPVWGNVLECWVQVDPVRGTVLGIVDGPDVEASQEGGENIQKKKQGYGDKDARPEPEKERVEYLDLLSKNPNYFGTLASSDLKVVKEIKGDTSYEELECVGLYPERNFMEAVLQVKRPYGFGGDLCGGGSHEHVRFFIDWDGDGDFLSFDEDLGVASVSVHDIPQAREFHLCYALGKRFRARRANCRKPYIVKVRAILSWQQVPTGPNFIPVWGNVVECWVQIRPTDVQPPNLVGQIDTPTVNDCVSPVAVTSCLTNGAPLFGIRITGSAGGTPFNNYTLRYSWGGPIINDAVVYPDCSRPPASPSASVPVFGGTLGYLDVTLLPPGVSEFTIYLDVFGAGPTVSVTRTFKLKSTSIEITAAAKVEALDAPDPFHPLTNRKLIKAVGDPNELSIGGSFSVDGSAYTVGCDRIMSQFGLAGFPAPPANPVPIISDLGQPGGVPIIAPVPYDDTPAHPWSSGCFPMITTNVITNGDLVALWSTKDCSFGAIDYTVDKVRPVPFWNSSALNGRFVILLEVRDRLVAGGAFPGDLAAVDQVAVWIDNRQPIAEIRSVGGLQACEDIHLKDYVGTTAAIVGVAWDPPIDATAPQQRPNDNFGSYSLSFQKNGETPPTPITVPSPNVRVPNIWPGPLASTDEGILVDWDIVDALDGGTGPLPPDSPKLVRGERCAYVFLLSVSDTTHVGDSGNHNAIGPVLYAVNIINDIT